MSSKDENDAISALTGFSLSHVLDGLELPAGADLSNRLGISGIPTLSSTQIYSDKWEDGEDAIGAEQGEDWEAEIDRELREEAQRNPLAVKKEAMSPGFQPRKKRTRTIQRYVERPKSVYELFPSYSKNKILDFTEILKGNTARKSRVMKRHYLVETSYPRKREQPKGFLDAIVGDTQRQVENKRVEEVVTAGSIDADLQKAIKERERSDVPVLLPLDDRTFDLVLLSNWEDQIMYEPDDVDMGAGRMIPETSLTTPANKNLESGMWTKSIIWGPDVPFKDFTQLEFNHEDDIIPEERSTETVRHRRRFRTDAAQIKDKFNLSNDHFYEVAKDGGRHRVRQTFGQLAVEHAYPAQKLQLPFYKTRLSKQEARSFHRPALQFPANIEIRFSKVRTAKKKKDKSGRKLGKGGNVGESLHKTGDLSLRDTSNFVLWEYSEEHPPIISNFGMGSAFVNYYRKKDEKDEYIPKAELGVPFVLEPQDESPFMKFGSVSPGQTVPALYNNLIRSPLFRHKSYPTDFLVIRRVIALTGDSKYFIREIKNLYVLGQTYPVTEVPGPHSRKITNTIKYRLQIIAFKLLKKSPGERLKISRLMKYFPDQNELQMRQRLKVGVFYPMTVDNFDISLLRSLWSITGEGPIRDSGDLNLQYQFLLMRKCLKWLTRSKSS
ncbi:hypothetical protein AGABI1DRAFT_67440 [Agaricus bisporus var. burnettii JB137-S8]|uniref:Transcription initiation factor TFIID subunit 1 histone acetyltransferase domain-containing protein n=1 Tax=Agaricus bisporus var. burnettii (strain JB137-S8 / ATCC MYA-4627 / FGSC 10392) TaxID=597362 RepID=K5XL90_AGABU|nr:uncharacterized protein AGABI1DRAFT_67440 [Agaricus bisporus var. burnettii JB137-S8]EKM84167.1 hypothetical protein AGABI1DRAFT_67440 [Agaricus bisporus var. burnettii JB137-S8]